MDGSADATFLPGLISGTLEKRGSGDAHIHAHIHAHTHMRESSFEWLR
jgi:hypothetical protein